MPDTQTPAVRGAAAADAIDEAAAAWFARRDAGWSTAEAASFQAWLAADPRHAAVWREFDEALAPLGPLLDAGHGAALARDLQRCQQRRRWRVVAGVSAGLAAAAAVALVFAPFPARAPASARPAVAINVLAPTLRELPDGSRVELNRGAEIVVDFTPERRGVRLIRGEAHFAVTKNPARPFVVAVNGIEVRAVGTAFAVHADAATVNVIVTEGRVAVAQAAADVFADAGMNVTVTAARDGTAPAHPSVTSLPSAEISRQLAWRQRKLELAGTMLTDAVAAFNRENRVQLRLADRATAELRMSGVFRADDAAGFARLLAENYRVGAERTGDEILLRLQP